MANKEYLDNTEAAAAWDGVLFDRFLEFKHLMTAGLGRHGDLAIDLHPPAPGARVIDIGCGFGDTAQRLAAIVGPEGSVVGVDVAPRFVEWATDDAERNGVSNVSFEIADLEVEAPEGPFDHAFSRMGTMFFANPVPAMRNIRSQLAPGARLCMVVWRQKPDNEWLHVAEQVVERWLDEPDPEQSDELTCGPGPFSMANANTVSGILVAAGFDDVTLRRCDYPITIGRDIDEAIAMNLAIGPGGEVIRLWGEKADEVRPQIETDLREALQPFLNDDGSVTAPASTWIVCGTNPE
jgi:SAM-dependent methyltransferase